MPEHRGLRVRFVTQPIDDAAGEQRVRGELVSTAAKGELTVIGLTPFETRAFSAVQRGQAVTLDAGIARRLGLEPYHLLDALHRGLWSEATASNATRVTREAGGAIEVESVACGYRTRLLVVGSPTRENDSREGE